MDIFSVPAIQIVQALREGLLTAEEVMQATLDRIDRYNPSINAIVRCPSRDSLLAFARAADQRKERGPLHGLPITIKDGIKVKGLECTLGCRGSYIREADVDAVAVQRLRAAGAIVIGQTNIPEMMAAFETDNLLYGRTNNPHNPGRIAGGSSGGEAAALASGCSFLGIGSDAGGSIRIPAHCCGVAGIKTSWGLVPMTGRIPSDAMGLVGQVGVWGTMGRSIDECELALSIIAGPHPADPYALPIPLRPSSEVDLSALRVGYYFSDGVAEPSDETIEAVKGAVELLRMAGASVEEVHFDTLKRAYDLIWDAFFVPSGAGLSSGLAAIGIQEIHPLLQRYVKRAGATSPSAAELAQVYYQVGLFRHEMNQHMLSYDLLVSPIMATPALEHGCSFDQERALSYSAAYNLTGWPAVAVPCALSSDGLPIGLQIVAKRWCDHVAIAAARHLEKELRRG